MVDIHRIGQLDLGGPRLERAAASLSPTCPCGSQAGLRAFLNQAPLKLREGRKDREDEFARHRRGIDRPLAQRAKPDLPLE